ncbi:hypothetical protein ACFL6E_07090 [Candidatus Neomarinimicrobiota bacterium]
MRTKISIVILVALFSVIPGLANGIFLQNFTAENDEFKLYKMHFSSSGGERGVTTFYYDDMGVNYEAIWELLDGTRSSNNYRSFDKDGNCIKKYREFSDSITSTNYYEYDEDGDLVKEDFERSDGVTGTTSYEYDANGRLLRANCNGFNGWVYGTITYEYDEHGKKIKGTITGKDNAPGSIEYSYDENGNLNKEHWNFADVWNMTFIYEYRKKSSSTGRLP